MNKYYLEILKKIENNGFHAYIVGGFVRDYLLGSISEDIDITTNATPEDLKKIFNNVVVSYEEYGAVKLKIENHIIDITTFRKELSYKDGKPNQIKYINSLEEDLQRRDFRVNTICMDKEENIIDLLNGKKDLEDKIIKTIRDPYIEFKEDPSRILRALRFMSELDFTLDKSIIDYITIHKEDLNRISISKRKEELDKLFKTKKVTKFLEFIKEYQLEEYIGIKSHDFKETDISIGVWSQLELLDNFPFTKAEKEQIKMVKELLEKKEITKFDIYKKGPYICELASRIMGTDTKEINLIYTNLPIKGIIDLDIKSGEICDILKMKPSKKLGRIIKWLEKEIVSGHIKNNKKEIIKKLLDSEVEYERFKE